MADSNKNTILTKDYFMANSSGMVSSIFCFEPTTCRYTKM